MALEAMGLVVAVEGHQRTLSALPDKGIPQESGEPLGHSGAFETKFVLPSFGGVLCFKDTIFRTYLLRFKMCRVSEKMMWILAALRMALFEESAALRGLAYTSRTIPSDCTYRLSLCTSSLTTLARLSTAFIWSFLSCRNIRNVMTEDLSKRHLRRRKRQAHRRPCLKGRWQQYR